MQVGKKNSATGIVFAAGGGGGQKERNRSQRAYKDDACWDRIGTFWPNTFLTDGAFQLRDHSNFDCFYSNVRCRPRLCSC